MATDEFKRARIIEEAIPSAIEYKQQILDARRSCILSLADVMVKKARRRRCFREMANFQTNVINLYQQIRVKFKKTHSDYKKISELDSVITGDKRLKWPELYNCFIILNDRIEEIGITKIERRKVDEDEVM